MANFQTDRSKYCVVDDETCRIWSWHESTHDALEQANRWGAASIEYGGLSIAKIVDGRIKAMSDAEEFLAFLEKDDACSVMTALDDAGFPSDQLWDDETTVWMFEDGSQIRVSGMDVIAAEAGETVE